MAKIGTAHVEIKPIINDEALAQITAAIEAAVKAGVEAGMKAAQKPTQVNGTTITVNGALDAEQVEKALRERLRRTGRHDRS